MFKIRSNRSRLVLFCAIAFFPYAARAQVMFMDKPVVDIVLDLIKFLLTIAGGFALLMLIASGISFSVSGGSVTARQGAKKMFFSALVGLFLVLMSYAIMVVIDNTFTKP